MGSPSRSCRSVFSVLILLELFPAYVGAQFRLDSWTADNGLPQNILRGVGQSRDGYLWIATLDGLVRFDGVRFTVFSNGNTPGIKSNRFTSLYFAPGGDFWAGTEAGGVTRFHHGNFTTYTAEQGLLGTVTGVAGDAAGRIWACSNSVIVEWREAEGKFVPIQTGYYPLAFENARGFGGVVNGEVRLFIGGKISHHPLPEHWPNVQTVVSQDLNGAIWISTIDGQTAKLSGGQWSKIFNSGARKSSDPVDPAAA
jgi:ligand-binding sensor domain-containing protein